MFSIAAVNWLAVLVAGVASFMLGGLWYTVFSKPWMKHTGITHEQTRAGGSAQMGASYGVAFLTYLIAVAVLGVLMSAAGAAGAGEGLLLGLLVGALAVAGIILGAWQ